ncbi:MAG: hypothetical protein OHK005_13440 [Candidatus Methylacidiphilales bacterium]
MSRPPIIPDDFDAQSSADAEVVVSELLACNRNRALKRAVSSVVDVADRGATGLKKLYTREPYLGLLAAGVCGLAVGLLIARR